MIWATVSSWSCFRWLYRAVPSLAAENIINLISVLTMCRVFSWVVGRGCLLWPVHFLGKTLLDYSSLRAFVYSSSVYSCHFLISFASGRSMPFLSFIVPIFAWNVPLLSQISWRDLSSFPFYFFPLFFCIVHLRKCSYLSLLFSGTLHSVEYIFPFLLSLSLLFPAICKAYTST